MLFDIYLFRPKRRNGELKKLKDKNKSLNKNGERKKKNNEDLINKKKLVDAEKVRLSYVILRDSNE